MTSPAPEFQSFSEKYEEEMEEKKEVLVPLTTVLGGGNQEQGQNHSKRHKQYSSEIAMTPVSPKSPSGAVAPPPLSPPSDFMLAAAENLSNTLQQSFNSELLSNTFNSNALLNFASANNNHIINAQNILEMVRQTLSRGRSSNTTSVLTTQDCMHLFCVLGPLLKRDIMVSCFFSLYL